VKIAYADPPYVGQAKHHYGCAEVNHHELACRLVSEFPDGWALSASSPSLFPLLKAIEWPLDCRIGAWVKPFHVFKKGVRPAYAWEPVIYRGGRNKNHPPPPKGGKQTTPRDWVSCNITLKRGLVGAKPEGFCFWLFDLMGMKPDDDLVDLFPGTGAVTRAWEKWRASCPT
jgi:hypothetical protein